VNEASSSISWIVRLSDAPLEDFSKVLCESDGCKVASEEAWVSSCSFCSANVDCSLFWCCWSSGTHRDCTFVWHYLFFGEPTEDGLLCLFGLLLSILLEFVSLALLWLFPCLRSLLRCIVCLVMKTLMPRMVAIWLITQKMKCHCNTNVTPNAMPKKSVRFVSVWK